MGIGGQTRSEQPERLRHRIGRRFLPARPEPECRGEGDPVCVWILLAGQRRATLRACLKLFLGWNRPLECHGGSGKKLWLLARWPCSELRVTAMMHTREEIMGARSRGGAAPGPARGASRFFWRGARTSSPQGIGRLRHGVCFQRSWRGWRTAGCKPALRMMRRSAPTRSGCARRQAD